MSEPRDQARAELRVVACSSGTKRPRRICTLVLDPIIDGATYQGVVTVPTAQQRGKNASAQHLSVRGNARFVCPTCQSTTDIPLSALQRAMENLASTQRVATVEHARLAMLVS